MGSRALGLPEGWTKSVRVASVTAQGAEMQRTVERALEEAGIPVFGALRAEERRKAFADHPVIVKSALLFASLLVLFVGLLGLTSTLALNVVQRTREFGVLVAIGAAPRRIGSYVLFESAVIALLSGALAIAASVPATLLLERVTGQIFIKAPLDFVMSPGGVALWLAVVTALALLGSLYPSRRAAQLSLREALAHE